MAGTAHSPTPVHRKDSKDHTAELSFDKPVFATQVSGESAGTNRQAISQLQAEIGKDISELRLSLSEELSEIHRSMAKLNECIQACYQPTADGTLGAGVSPSQESCSGTLVDNLNLKEGRTTPSADRSGGGSLGKSGKPSAGRS